MAKTKPIGVRFDKDLLDAIKEKGFADSPQKSLNLYEETYKKWAAGVFVEMENKAIDTETDDADSASNNSEIEKQIEAVKNETKPSWILKSQFEKYQEKKIAELKKQLK